MFLLAYITRLQNSQIQNPHRWDMTAPLAALLASLAPLVLDFDPGQWQAWQQFSSSFATSEQYSNDSKFRISESSAVRSKLLSNLVDSYYKEIPSSKVPTKPGDNQLEIGYEHPPDIQRLSDYLLIKIILVGFRCNL